MAPSTRTEPAGDDRGLVAWIDRALEDGRPALEVAAELARNAMPEQGGRVTPFVYGSEGWYWSWNRAGFGYIERGRHHEAATIFTGAYLAALRFQDDFQERLHKGTPLCNVAYSYLLAEATMTARVPAMLGVIEDITAFIDPAATGSLNNLRASGYSEPQLSYLNLHTSEFYLKKGRYPLYPEVVLHSMARDTLDTDRCVADIRGIASRFEPASVESSCKALGNLWRRYAPGVPAGPPRGDFVHGRAEPGVRVDPAANSGSLPVAGSLATP